MALSALETKLIQHIPRECTSLLVVGVPRDEWMKAVTHHILSCTITVAGWEASRQQLSQSVPDNTIEGVVCLVPEVKLHAALFLETIQKVLRPGGWVLAAFSNAQHHSVISGLLRGHFPHSLKDKNQPATQFTYAGLIKVLLDHEFIPHLMDAQTDPAPPLWLEDIRPILDGLGLHAERTRRYLDISTWLVRGIYAPMDETDEPIPMTLSVCVSDDGILHSNLLSSPDLAGGHHQVIAWRKCPNAALGHNRAIREALHEWVLCIHQDVYLPAGWISRFQKNVQLAESRFGMLSVAGVYGIANSTEVIRYGHIVDRDRVLCETLPPPQLVNSLDEVLLAVRKSSSLRFEPTLGWHFYGTDICLSAEERGERCAVVDALCFHNSLSLDVPVDFKTSMERFAIKWRVSVR